MKLTDMLKALVGRYVCYACDEDIKDGYRTDEGTICQECYKKRWEKTVCEQCHQEFGEGYMARKPDGQFALMCRECYENLWEAVTDDRAGRT